MSGVPCDARNTPTAPTNSSTTRPTTRPVSSAGQPRPRRMARTLRRPRPRRHQTRLANPGLTPPPPRWRRFTPLAYGSLRATLAALRKGEPPRVRGCPPARPSCMEGGSEVLAAPFTDPAAVPALVGAPVGAWLLVRSSHVPGSPPCNRLAPIASACRSRTSPGNRDRQLHVDADACCSPAAIV